MTTRKPDYRLKCKERAGTHQAVLGAGWKEADGSISIEINLGVVIDHRLWNDCTIRLFPIDK